jgi:ATP-dependent Lon protease
VRDEAEIRGHRRTYIGAMPGVIIRALRDAGSANPLFMIDEIDKLGSDYRGDPASALLEVLDPEQNANFRDHYLDVPFDLSHVMFVTTANTLDTIPGRCATAWRSSSSRLHGGGEAPDRQRYLVPRQIERNGLKRSQVTFSDTGLRAIIEQYTREAGVRGLEREIGSICRKVARAVAEGRHERKADGHRAAGARAARPPALAGDAAAHARAGRGDRPGLDAGRRRRAVRRGGGDARQRAS